MNYLPERRIAETRIRGINWVSYKNVGIISDHDFNTITAVERSPELYFTDRADISIKTLLRLLTVLYKEELAIQSLLVLIDDGTQTDSEERIQFFHDYSSEREDGVWGPFMELLKHDNRFIAHMSAHFLARLSTCTRVRMPSSDQFYYFLFLKSQLNSANPSMREYTQTEVHCLQMMLVYEEYRKEFMNVDGVSLLVRLLPNANYQIQYQIIFVLWVVTFTPDIAAYMSIFNIIPNLTIILKDSNKEKLTRVILALFRNLVDKPTDEKIVLANLAMLIQCELNKTLQNMQKRYINDDDIIEHMEYLISKLDQAMDEMCSFTQYCAELKSGQLKWTPVHRSKKFWIENVLRLNDNNYEILRLLIELLETSSDPLVLAIACQDIGQYVRRYPEGKNIFDNLGGKVLVLKLLYHENADVRYEALTTGAQLLKVT